MGTDLGLGRPERELRSMTAEIESAAPMGPPRVLHVGHDLQLVGELSARDDFAEPGVLFTPAELARVASSAQATRSLAGLFSIKEAFFKAMPVQSGWYWTELEVQRDVTGQPRLAFSGALARLMRERSLSADVSLSHSGQYVSSVVIIHSG